MKTLATLSANGFEAVYIEVVYVITADQLGRFFFRFPLTAIIHSEVFTDIATSMKVDRTGQCLLTRCIDGLK